MAGKTRRARRNRRPAWRARWPIAAAAVAAAGVFAAAQSVQPSIDHLTPVAAAPSPAPIATPLELAARDALRPSAAPSECGAGEAQVQLTVDFSGDGTELCLPLSTDVRIGSRVDPAYTRAAKAATEQISERTDAAQPRSTVVVCWSYGDWNLLGKLFEERNFTFVGVFGFVSAPLPVINISPETCRLLDQIAHDGTRSHNIGLGKAVGVLTHEAMHVAGIMDEAAAECYAVQLTATTAGVLGADAEYAAVMQQRNWQFDQDYWDESEYFSPECRDGGALDLDPNSTFSP